MDTVDEFAMTFGGQPFNNVYTMLYSTLIQLV